MPPPRQVVEIWLSDTSDWQGILVAWIAGVLTPIGSLMRFPFVATLYKAGAGIGVLITYLTSPALLSLLRIPIEASFYGGRLMTLRVSLALVLPQVAGLLARALAPVLPGRLLCSVPP